MRWLGGRESSNIEDRRGVGVARGVGIGGIGTVAIVLIGLFLGVDPSILLDMVGGDPAPQTQTGRPGDPGYGSSAAPRSAGDDQTRQFVSVVLADTEDVWRQAFGDMGRSYEEPKLVLYSAPSSPPAAWRLPPRVRSTARAITRSISTCRSSRTCAGS